MTDGKPPNSELDEIEERLGDPWDMTERDYEFVARCLGFGLAIIALICLGGWLVCRYVSNGNA